jgi:hypothetical protein
MLDFVKIGDYLKNVKFKNSIYENLFIICSNLFCNTLQFNKLIYIMLYSRKYLLNIEAKYF